MIQQRIEDMNQSMNILQEHGLLTKKVLAIGIEMNQLYLEYLDELQDNVTVENSVRVALDGQVVKFENMDKFSDWLAGQL